MEPWCRPSEGEPVRWQLVPIQISFLFFKTISRPRSSVFRATNNLSDTFAGNLDQLSAFPKPKGDEMNPCFRSKSKSTEHFRHGQLLIATLLMTGFLLATTFGCGSQTQVDSISTGENQSDSRGLKSRHFAPNTMPTMGIEMAAQLGAGMGMDPSWGLGPGMAGNQYDHIEENAFKLVTDSPLSTFSIDVDTASYRNVRQFLLEYNQLPRPDAVRTEELINYFLYNYQGPDPEQNLPFAVRVNSTNCPWNKNHRLVRVALKGKQIELNERPNMNLVLLLDTSGSMKQPNKLPLLKQGMRLLLNQLDDADRIAIIAYAGTPGLVLESTTADQKEKIMDALNRLEAGGSTNGGGGIELAYKIAREHFIDGGTNRVILGTDGDFNVGMTGTDQLIELVKNEASQGVDLTVLGFGMGNYNDSMLEQISGCGNGNYAFIDTYSEARKVLLEQLSSTLITIAKDVKIQVEFNPNLVASYRLIGYENRMLEAEDFNNDKKDAGEIGAGHAVTALYEIVPPGVEQADIPKIDPLKYQTTRETKPAGNHNELLTVKLRYKHPENNTSEKLELAVADQQTPFSEIDSEFQFAAAVANFGLQLRKSEYRGDWTYSDIESIARSAKGDDPHGFRDEFLQMVSVARSLSTVDHNPETGDHPVDHPALPGLNPRLNSSVESGLPGLGTGLTPLLSR